MAPAKSTCRCALGSWTVGALREKPGGKPASPKGNRHTRLTIPVLWHPLGIDCHADSNGLTDASLC